MCTACKLTTWPHAHRPRACRPALACALGLQHSQFQLLGRLLLGIQMQTQAALVTDACAFHVQVVALYFRYVRITLLHSMLLWLHGIVLCFCLCRRTMHGPFAATGPMLKLHHARYPCTGITHIWLPACSHKMPTVMALNACDTPHMMHGWPSVFKRPCFAAHTGARPAAASHPNLQSSTQHSARHTPGVLTLR